MQPIKFIRGHNNANNFIIINIIMKKSIFTLLFISLISCKDKVTPDLSNEELILGTWHFYESIENGESDGVNIDGATITFQRNGIGFGKVDGESSGLLWKLMSNGDSLEITSLAEIDDPTTNQYKITRLTKDYLWISYIYYWEHSYDDNGDIISTTTYTGEERLKK